MSEAILYSLKKYADKVFREKSMIELLFWIVITLSLILVIISLFMLNLVQRGLLDATFKQVQPTLPQIIEGKFFFTFIATTFIVFAFCATLLSVKIMRMMHEWEKKYKIYKKIFK